MNLYIYNYNNYYNRIVNKEDSLQDYEQYLIYGPLTGVYGFTPGDGVNTTQLIGTNATMYDGSGDYLIVHNPQTNEIVSRWFIIDSNRTREGQWKLTLHRDLIVDFYDTVINSTCFIEKATLLQDNPLIFNSEQMSVNQIKTSETLIKDKSGCPWIVGYYSKKVDNVEDLKGTAQINNLEYSYDIAIDTSFSEWEYNFTNTPYEEVGLNGANYVITTKKDVSSYKRNFFFDFVGNYIGNMEINQTVSNTFGLWYPDSFGTSFEPIMKENRYQLYNEAINYANFSNINTDTYVRNLNGKILKDGTGTFYTLTVEPVGTKTNTFYVQSGSLYNTLKNLIDNSSILLKGEVGNDSFSITTISHLYKMTATITPQTIANYDMSGEKLVTIDAPYNIFAIPYGDVTLKDAGVTKVTSNKEVAINVANALIQNMGAILYDIQLLPYCPLDIKENGIIDVLSSLSYSLITDSTEAANPIGFILNISNAQFSKDILLEQSINITNAKMQSECDVYKLCSPNWASEFQFNVAKNGGLQYFNIDCEYKPYQPYIHINPNFGRLYGRDFNDARGLILSGDFSLSQISDAWEQYQIQNKNFQNIFDRQIKNMEIQNKMGRIQDIVGGIVGTAQGAATGGALQTFTAPGTGFGIGAGVGAAVSAIGGIADYAINETLRNEAIDYAKDNFGYQLGNIQALPYTLTKVSAFNNNNKIFPVLEYYTCTDIEKEALANKIAWNGMSVMTIGKISDYIGNNWSYTTTNGKVIESQGYIKGQLIRLTGIQDDYHIVNAISGEIYKGVYIK